MTGWYKYVLYYLWVAPHLLLAAVPVLMFVRRLHRSFPIFFVYTIYETLEFLLLFGITVINPAPANSYRYAYILTLAGSTALRFGVIQEVLTNISYGYPRLEALATASMRWVTALLVLAAVLLALYTSGTVADDAMAGVALLSRSVAVIQAGLLLFLFLFSQMFGLSWRNFAFGVALGFAVFASTELGVWAVRATTLSEYAKNLLDLLPTGSYHISVLVWLGYMLRAERPVVSAPAVPEMDQWSRELERSSQ